MQALRVGRNDSSSRRAADDPICVWTRRKAHHKACGRDTTTILREWAAGEKSLALIGSAEAGRLGGGASGAEALSIAGLEGSRGWDAAMGFACAFGTAEEGSG